MAEIHPSGEYSTGGESSQRSAEEKVKTLAQMLTGIKAQKSKDEVDRALASSPLKTRNSQIIDDSTVESILKEKEVEVEMLEI